MILRLLAALQDRYLRFRYRRYRAPLPRIGYADEAVRAYVNAVRYRKYRRYVLAGVLAWMLIRRAAS
mgnify:CR=1 FL=1